MDIEKIFRRRKLIVTFMGHGKRFERYTFPRFEEWTRSKAMSGASDDPTDDAPYELHISEMTQVLP